MCAAVRAIHVRIALLRAPVHRVPAFLQEAVLSVRQAAVRGVEV